MTPNATQAIMTCADLVRHANPDRPITPVTIDSDADRLVISATDGYVALCFTLGPDTAHFSPGVRNGRCDQWPRWGSNPWEIRSQTQYSALCIPRTKSGRQSKREPAQVPMTPGRNPAVDLLAKTFEREDLGSRSVLRCELTDILEPLHESAEIALVTNREGSLVVACGPWSATLSIEIALPSAMHFRAGILESAVNALDGWGDLVVRFPHDPLDPLILKAGCARAIVMPLRKS